MKEIKFIVIAQSGAILTNRIRENGQHKQPIPNTIGEFHEFPVDFYPIGDLVSFKIEDITPELAHDLTMLEYLRTLVRIDNEYNYALPEKIGKYNVKVPISNDQGLAEIQSFYSSFSTKEEKEKFKKSVTPEKEKRK